MYHELQRNNGHVDIAEASETDNLTIEIPRPLITNESKSPTSSNFRTAPETETHKKGYQNVEGEAQQEIRCLALCNMLPNLFDTAKSRVASPIHKGCRITKIRIVISTLNEEFCTVFQQGQCAPRRRWRRRCIL